MSNQFRVGQKACYSKTVTESDVLHFSSISGDLNPLHIDDLYAKKSMFGKRIAHGMLTAGLISAVLGMKLPGPGTIYLSQQLHFLKPVYPGDTVSAKVEIFEISEKPPRIKLVTKCLNQHGDVVLDGEALVKPPVTGNDIK